MSYAHRRHVPPPRCPETSREGARCIYDEGHVGQHFAKDAFSYYAWPHNPDAYDKRRDEELDFPDDPREEPTLEEVKANATFVCVVDESAGLRDG